MSHKTILLNKTITGLVASSFIAVLVMSMPGCGGSDSAAPAGSSPTLSLLAGNLASPNGGNLDGTGAQAVFGRPAGIATDSAGNVYVSDSNTCTIRKVTSAGVVSTLAGYPYSCVSIDGTGAAAGFNFPRGLAVDSTGANLYVADKSSHVIRKVVIASGAVTTVAGSPGVSGYVDDADPAVARFSNPVGVAIDGSNNLYVAETGRGGNYTVRKITPAGVVSTVAGAPRSCCGGGTTKDVDGTGAAAGFAPLSSIVVDSTGTNLYVTNTKGDTIRMITAASGVVTTYQGVAHGGSCCGGSTDDPTGIGGTATFSRPHGLAIDSAGNLFVADSGNGTIRMITAASGIVSTLAGTAGNFGSDDGTGAAASFSNLQAIAIDSTGSNLYVADTNNTIRKVVIATGVVTTLAGAAAKSGSADGTGAAASFAGGRGVKGMATDSAGNVYVADRNNGSVRKITPAGVVTTLATGLNQPRDVVVDSAGNIYALDRNGNVSHITAASGVVGTVPGFNNRAGGMAADSAGNLYVADNASCVIKKISNPSLPASAVVSTVAGTGTCGFADGNATTAAKFDFPQDIAVDSAGNLYVADSRNQVIRKVTPDTVAASSVVSTVAGRPVSAGYKDGTGGLARFSRPVAMAMSSTGNIYVIERSNHTVRKVTPAGVVTTVAGSPTGDLQKVKTGALPVEVDPRGIAINGNTLYIFQKRGVAKITPLP